MGAGSDRRARLTASARRALPVNRPPLAAGVVVMLAAVALATLAVSALKLVAPVLSLGVVYLAAVLLVATWWGAALGLLSALLSGAAYNFFHLPPTGRFTIADDRSWVSLAAFVVVALVVSAVAELARERALEAERRRLEADLAAAMARELLLGEDTDRALSATARRISEALGLASAAIVIPDGTDPAGSERAGRRARRGLTVALLDAADRPVATLQVTGDIDPDTEARLRGQVAPTLGALVEIVRRRDTLQAQRVETEALRRSDDIKTALLRAVSHDLRTPLTAVVAAGHALGSPWLDDVERGELSESVVSEATRLARLVDNLLDLSRLQAGAARPRADWVSIEELVAVAAQGRDGEPLHYELAIDDDVPEIRADAAQLERALANLMENARRHGDGGPVHVGVRTGGDRVLISVVDHGPGIDPAELGRIFEPFYRGRHHPTSTPAGGDAPSGTGSGLGLAIVKGFVEANGGTIEVSSLPGQGTSFQISLPLAAEVPA